MSLRTLYLQKALNVNGRHSLAGRRLYDTLRQQSDDCLLGHIVLSNEEAARYSDPRLKADIISYDLVKQLDPTLIYIEGGLFSHECTWRIPREFAEELVNQGVVLIVADVDVNELSHKKKCYKDAANFLGSVADYGPDDDDDPVYGVDEVSFWKGHRQIVCLPEKMVISDWLRPVYSDVSEILVGLPVKLVGWEDLLASANGNTTKVLQLDVWIDDDCCPFATAARRGHGYVVFIAGLVSSDVWLERCPDNVKWLSNIAQFLVEEASHDRRRSTSHLRSPFTLFLSHRSVNKARVEPVADEIKRKGVGIWLDKERLAPSDSLIGEISRGLEQMTHFVLFWSNDCVGAPWVERELHAATAQLIQRRLPILIVRLDSTPVPAILADLFRIEGEGLSPSEIADAVVSAVERIAKRASPPS